MLITNLADVRYLCGFTGSNAALLLVGGRATLFTDGRYTTQAHAEVDGAKIVIVVDQSAAVAACECAVAKGVSGCGFDQTQTTVAHCHGPGERRGLCRRERSWLDCAR
jgi:Xaa-Pro aminopeptidase